MKKLLFAISLFCLASCRLPDNSNATSIKTDSRIFYISGGGNSYMSVICDRDTRVEYLVVKYTMEGGVSVTPLYNADGTLKTYKGQILRND